MRSKTKSTMNDAAAIKSLRSRNGHSTLPRKIAAKRRTIAEVLLIVIMATMLAFTP